MQSKRILSIALVMTLILVISIGSGYTQDENLLVNAGFEDGFSDGVADGWQAWNAEESFPPFYSSSAGAESSAIPTQVNTGSEAQVYYSTASSHDAGIYQQVSNVEVGTEYVFSIFAYLFSNNGVELDTSADPGDLQIQVGIDPTGGTDPASSNVVFSNPAGTLDSYQQYSISVVATSNTVTVFVRTFLTEDVTTSIVYLDTASLTAVAEEPEPTEEATEAPVPTEEMTEEPIATEEMTEEPIATEEMTEEPIATEEATEEPEPEESILDMYPEQITHTVQRGDNVNDLAIFYGSSIAAILEANDLDESALIFIGQVLVIPVKELPQDMDDDDGMKDDMDDDGQKDARPHDDEKVGAIVYIVDYGDTLYHIANRFDTTVGAIVQLNGLSSANHIFVGQPLFIPSDDMSRQKPDESYQAPDDDKHSVPVYQQPDDKYHDDDDDKHDGNGYVYIVQPGDTLYRISIKFDVSLIELAEANNIKNYQFVFVGQALIIPDTR